MDNFELGKSANIHIYEKLIPESLIKGYKLTNILLTTYGMEIQVLTKLLIALDGLAIVNDGVDVFYDVQPLQMTEGDYSILPDCNVHGINLYKEGKKYAFHPKIIMLRYENSENNAVRYVLTVLSKNITNAKNLDAFCVVYGDVQSAGEVCVEETDNNNGQLLADWIKKLYEGASGEAAKGRGYFYTKELPKVIFRCEDPSVKEVRFLTESHMRNELEKLEDIIIVSPFISGTLVEMDYVKKVISRGEEYGKLSDEAWKNIEEKGKAYQFAEEAGEENCTNSMVHAKIYCGKINNQTRLIIGSSNATVNGCAWNKIPTNMEFNVALTLEEKAYEAFESGLEEYIISLKAREEKEAETQQNEERHVFGSFLMAIEEIEANMEENGWKFSLALCQEFFREYPNVVVHLLEEKGVKSQDSNNRLECKCNKARECLWINIKYGEIENEYCLRLAPYIKNQCYQEALKKLHLDDYNQVIKQKIDCMLRNSKNVTLTSKIQSAKTQNISQRKTQDKRYVYEKLKGLAIIVQRAGKDSLENVSLEERYREQLVQLKKHADLIREEQEYKDMSRAIGELLGIEGEK